MSARPALTGEYKLSNRPLQQSTELLKIQVALAQKAGVNEKKIMNNKIVHKKLKLDLRFKPPRCAKASHSKNQGKTRKHTWFFYAAINTIQVTKHVFPAKMGPYTVFLSFFEASVSAPVYRLTPHSCSRFIHLRKRTSMSVLSNPAYRPILEALRSSRNGVVYGGKIRFSHALVINLLYRSGPMGPRLKQVLKATKEHSLVLAAFAIVYKTVLNILRQEKLLGSKQGFSKLIAGAVGGWIVYSQHFSAFNPGITHQITLYCFSRVLIAVGKILLDLLLECRQPKFKIHGELVLYRDLNDAQARRLKSNIYNKSWKYFAVATWALVMFIYDYKPQYLQSSLRHSMAYIYDVEMDTWPTWRDFIGF